METMTSGLGLEAGLPPAQSHYRHQSRSLTLTPTPTFHHTILLPTRCRFYGMRRGRRRRRERGRSTRLRNWR